MQAIPRSPFVRFVVIPLTLAAFLAGCTHWATVEPPWAEAIAEGQPDRARVTLADGTQRVLERPFIEQDSVAFFEGLPAGLKHLPAGLIPTKISLLDISRVEVRKIATGRTIALIAGVGLGAAIVLKQTTFSEGT